MIDVAIRDEEDAAGVLTARQTAFDDEKVRVEPQNRLDGDLRGVFVMSINPSWSLAGI